MVIQDTENWLPIPGYEGLYEISDLGRIRGIKRVIDTARGWSRTIHPRMLSLANDRGYMRVTLSDHNRKKKSHWVHRLVLLAFVGPCPDGMETLHGFGGSGDNRVANLRWGTPTENAQDIVKHGHNLNANKTECKRGHRLSGSNLIVLNEAKSWRACRACTRERVYSHAKGKEFSTAGADARYSQYLEDEQEERP